jgi:hypothetical protein
MLQGAVRGKKFYFETTIFTAQVVQHGRIGRYMNIFSPPFKPLRLFNRLEKYVLKEVGLSLQLLCFGLSAGSITEVSDVTV